MTAEEPACGIPKVMRHYVAALLLTWLSLNSSPGHAGGAAPCEDAALIEYSYGGFSNGDVIFGPMLLPPMVKVYDDGRVVFHRNGRFWASHYSDRDLERLKRYLRKKSLLDEMGIEDVEHGSSAGFHGGMAYIRYCGEQGEIIKGALRLPSRGRWSRLIDRLRSTLPDTGVAFVPDQLEVRVWKSSARDAVPWPFHERLDLSTMVDEKVHISDREISRFLFEHLEGGFSWLKVDVEQGDVGYQLVLEEVPGWYGGTDLEMVLGLLADSHLNPVEPVGVE